MSDVRQIMKQGTGAKISGKEKAQMLKEKRKMIAEGNPAHRVVPPAKLSTDAMRQKREVYPGYPVSEARVSSHYVPVAASVTSSIAPSLLPSGFFDDGDAAPAAPARAVASSAKGVPPSASAPVAATAIPVGFFDNVEDDFAARGLNVHRELEKQDAAMDAALSGFLVDVQETVETLPDEEEGAEAEEEAVQHAYRARLVDLLLRSDGADGGSVSAELAQYRGSLAGGNSSVQTASASSSSAAAAAEEEEDEETAATGDGNDAAIEMALRQKYSYAQAGGQSSEEEEDDGGSGSGSDSSEEEEETVGWTSRSFL
jgi:hypothetical protein